MKQFNEITKELKNKNVAIATSGGADSMALCHLCKEQDLSAISIIVDHKYRDNSSEEASQVKKELKKHGIDSVILTNKKPIPETNIEKFLREVRYELITDYCKEHSIDCVLTAHHQDDNVETFLMRLERGSSVDGLSGIKQSISIKGINFIRPLLTLSKKELLDYLNNNNLQWFEDETNSDTKFTRNKIRHILSELGDDDLLIKRISGVIASFDRLSDYLDSELTKTKAYIYTSDNILKKREFLELHQEMAMRLLKDYFLKIYEDKNKFRFEKIERLYNFIKNEEGKTELAGVKINVTKNEIIFLKN